MKKAFRWEFFALVAATIAIAFFLLRQNRTDGYATAHIIVNGQEIRAVALSSAGNETFSLRQEYGIPVDFEIRDHAIRFVNVDCPDHICEKTGFVGTDGATAVCMPNRTTVVITGGEN